MMSSRMWWCAGLAVAGVSVGADPYPTDRDRIISEADTFYNLDWYCSEANIYSGWTGCTCDYTVAGWKFGMAYKWGGYHTVDGFLADIAAGAGAGDVNSSAVDSRCAGVDCSGYVSRIWESGRYATASFANASDNIEWTDLRMGDALNYAGSHIRLFVRWEDATHLWVYESTTGVDPGRVTLRTLARSSFNNYQPIRYHRDSANLVRIDPEPTILWARPSGADSAWIPFDGEADSGFRVEHSTDGQAWTQIIGEAALPLGAFRADPAGLAAGTDHFFRVIAVNTAGVTAPSDTLAMRFERAGDPSILIVDGIDRWRRLNGGQPGHTFVVNVAKALGARGLGYASCSNEMIATGMVKLTDFDIVIWLLGTDSTDDESISRGEQAHVREYLEQGGNLFVSGAELAWDLSHQTASARFHDVTDASMLQDYLRVSFLADGTGGNGHGAEGVAGTLGDGLVVHFDDGTHGTYDVSTPDSFTPQSGSAAWLSYTSNSQPALVSYEGLFGAGTETGRVAVMGFPLETVYDTAERQALVDRVLAFFGVPGSSGITLR